MDRGRHEVVAQRVHGEERGESGGVAEVVFELPGGEGGAAGRLHRQQLDALVGDKGQGEAAEVGAATAATDDQVGLLLARQLELLLGLQADHGLVEEHVVEHRPQRVVGVLTAARVADGVADRHAERAGAVGLVHRRGHHLTAPGLHHQAPVGLLLVGGPHHVDLALDAKERTGEGERAPPLAGTRLRGDALDPLLTVVVGLGNGGIGLVRAGRGDRLVLVVDPRRGVERLLEAAGTHQGSRAPEAEDVEDRARDVDPGVGRHLLEDQGHRKEGGEVLWASRLPRYGVECRVNRLRQPRHDVKPGFRKSIGRHIPAHESSLDDRRAVAGTLARSPGGGAVRHSGIALSGDSPKSPRGENCAALQPCAGVRAFDRRGQILIA